MALPILLKNWLSTLATKASPVAADRIIWYDEAGNASKAQTKAQQDAQLNLRYPTRPGSGEVVNMVLAVESLDPLVTKWVGIVLPGEKAFTVPGTLVVGAGILRVYFTRTVTVTNVWASVATAPTGSTAIFDVNKNGTTIFTTQANRPTIAISGFSDLTSTPNVTSFASGDYLTVDVDQIGSTIAGANAVVGIEFTEPI